MIAVIISAYALAASPCSLQGARLAFSIDVLRDQGANEVALPGNVRLSIGREGASVISVSAQDEPYGYNLIYRNAHGPTESDIAAWAIQNRYYPKVRRIPVRGHPLEIIIDARDAETAVDKSDFTGVRFTGGKAQVCWRHGAVRRQ